MHRTIAATLLLAAAALAGDAAVVSFALPDASGKRTVRLSDLGGRYALLVYQGVP